MSRVSVETARELFMTWETVATETPARRATSLIVVIATLFPSPDPLGRYGMCLLLRRRRFGPPEEHEGAHRDIRHAPADLSRPGRRLCLGENAMPRQRLRKRRDVLARGERRRRGGAHRSGRSAHASEDASLTLRMALGRPRIARLGCPLAARAQGRSKCTALQRKTIASRMLSRTLPRCIETNWLDPRTCLVRRRRVARSRACTDRVSADFNSNSLCKDHAYDQSG